VGSRYHSLLVSQWPATDREAWHAARAPAVRLKSGGIASHLKPASRNGLARAYGYFLEFCKRTDRWSEGSIPADLVTPEGIAAYLDELEQRVGSVTRHTYISRLCRMAALLAPSRDVDWLRQIEADIKQLVRPRSRSNRIVDLSRPWRLGLELMSRAEDRTDLTNLQRARLYREGLMIAFLAVCPIRLGNFARLELNRHIRQFGEEWWVVLEAAETKSGRHDERPLPIELGGRIERWLAQWRPTFISTGDAFWPSTKGGSLAYTFVGSIISSVTRRELGVDVSPHLFRHSAVHTIAAHRGDRIAVGTAILQHTDPRTTNIYNTKARTIQAGRALQAIVTSLIE